jgi:hypothetical protein
MFMTDQNTQLKPFDLEQEVLQVYKIPQCLTDGLSVDFVLDIIDFSTVHPEWQVTDPAQKHKRVERCLEKMEEEGKLRSKVTKVKERFFNDDEETPSLRPRVRVYELVR